MVSFKEYDMMEHLNHFSDCKEHADLLVSKIVGTVATAKIICFGIRRWQSESCSCFLCTSRKTTNFSFDLLVIVRQEERRQRFELLNAIESAMMNTGIQVTVCVHTYVAVCEAIANGSTFFSRVCHAGLTLYEDVAGSGPISIDRASNDVPEALHIWKRSYRLAGDFLAGAFRFCSSGAANIAAFMLHQAVEHTCIALIRLVMGYRASTHNLRRLLAMTGNFSDAGYSRFPCSTEEETALFSKLSRAYSDVRYKEDFNIEEAQAHILAERVKGLYEDAGRIYKEMLATGSLSRFYYQNDNHHELEQDK